MNVSTECHKCGGGTGQPKPCGCAVEHWQGIERRNVERREFVSKFVAERIKAGTWPESDMLHLVMLNELIDAWENRLR